MTKALTPAQKEQRAAQAAARAAKAAGSDSPEAKQQAAAGLVGVDNAGPEAPKGHVGKTLTVACKVPGGLIIQAYGKVVEYEPVMGQGKRAVDRWRPVGQQFKLHGPMRMSDPNATSPNVHTDSGGYAITEGVPAEMFEDWMRHNEDSPIVKNHLIFGHEKIDAAKGWAREHAGTKTNVEPLNVSLVAGADGTKRIADPRARKVAPAVTDGKVEVDAA